MQKYVYICKNNSKNLHKKYQKNSKTLEKSWKMRYNKKDKVYFVYFRRCEMKNKFFNRILTTLIILFLVVYLTVFIKLCSNESYLASLKTEDNEIEMQNKNLNFSTYSQRIDEKLENELGFSSKLKLEIHIINSEYNSKFELSNNIIDYEKTKDEKILNTAVCTYILSTLKVGEQYIC